MRIDFRFLGLAGAVSALVGLGQIAACTSDSNPGGAGGSAGGSSGLPGATGGTTGTPGGTGGTTTAVGTVCAKPILLAKPGIADFDNYPAGAALSTWSFSLGGDATSGIYAGTFGYGDRPNGLPETFAMVDGNSSKYALEIADTASAVYGGGMGL